SHTLIVHSSSIMWSLFLPTPTDVEPPHNTNPLILFLLVNLIIFLIFISLHHAQQHTASVSRKAARKKRRIAELAAAESLEIDRIKSLQPLLQNEPTRASTETELVEGAATADVVTAETNSAFDASAMMAGRSMAVLSSDCMSTAAAVTALQGHPFTSIEGSSANEELTEAAASTAASMETLPTQDSNAPPAAISAHVSEPCWTVDKDGRPAETVEKIVLEEDGQLRLVEVPEGPQQEDQRLRWIDSPVYSSDNNDPHTIPFKKPEGRSISLNSHHLSTSDPHMSPPYSRSRVKSMDATNDNTLDCWPTHAKSKFKGNNKVVKRDKVVKKAFRLRREPSINNQDELNARVESFIAAFNEKMKIQRQQSLLSNYMQMVARGA
ncbi:hypothetical protein GOP47_0017251, partial [Adiantum capillus-veneris]